MWVRVNRPGQVEQNLAVFFAAATTHLQVIPKFRSAYLILKFPGSRSTLFTILSTVISQS
jgi:hypothetical protein